MGEHLFARNRFHDTPPGGSPGYFARVVRAEGALLIRSYNQRIPFLQRRLAMQAVLTLCLLTPALDAPRDNDATAIEGTWTVVSLLEDGKAIDEVKSITFKCGKTTASRNGGEVPGTYKLDPSQKAKTISVNRMRTMN